MLLDQGEGPPERGRGSIPRTPPLSPSPPRPPPIRTGPASEDASELEASGLLSSGGELFGLGSAGWRTPSRRPPSSRRTSSRRTSSSASRSPLFRGSQRSSTDKDDDDGYYDDDGNLSLPYAPPTADEDDMARAEIEARSSEPGQELWDKITKLPEEMRSTSMIEAYDVVCKEKSEVEEILLKSHDSLRVTMGAVHQLRALQQDFGHVLEQKTEAEAKLYETEAQEQVLREEMRKDFAREREQLQRELWNLAKDLEYAEKTVAVDDGKDRHIEHLEKELRGNAAALTSAREDFDIRTRELEETSEYLEEAREKLRSEESRTAKQQKAIQDMEIHLREIRNRREKGEQMLAASSEADEKQKAAAQQKIKELETRLVQAAERISEHERLLSEAQDKHNGLLDSLSQRDRQLGEKDQLLKEAQEKARELGDSRKGIADLQLKIGDLESQADRARGEASEQVNQIGRLREEKEGLLRSVAEKEQELEQKLGQIAALQSQSRELEGRISELRDDNELKDKALDSMDKRSADVERTAALELEKAEESIRDLRKACKELNGTIESLRTAEFEGIEKVKHLVEQAREDRERFNAQIEGLEADKSNSAEAVGEFRDRLAQVERELVAERQHSGDQQARLDAVMEQLAEEQLLCQDLNARIEAIGEDAVAEEHELDDLKRSKDLLARLRRAELPAGELGAARAETTDLGEQPAHLRQSHRPPLQGEPAAPATGCGSEICFCALVGQLMPAALCRGGVHGHGGAALAGGAGRFACQAATAATWLLLLAAALPGDAVSVALWCVGAGAAARRPSAATMVGAGLAVLAATAGLVVLAVLAERGVWVGENARRIWYLREVVQGGRPYAGWGGLEVDPGLLTGWWVRGGLQGELRRLLFPDRHSRLW